MCRKVYAQIYLCELENRHIRGREKSGFNPQDGGAVGNVRGPLRQESTVKRLAGMMRPAHDFPVLRFRLR